MTKTLFTDLGGVLLTNGWDRGGRTKAAEHFNLDKDDVDERHHLTFDTYEIGRLSLDEYLDRTIFNQYRPFSREDFKGFMFSQSKPLPGMLEMIKELREAYDFRLVAISNEGRELAQYRIDSFGLRTLFDAFFVSGFLHVRKPDATIFEIAMDAMQAPKQSTLYMDDRLLFVEVANSLGLNAFQHVDLETTKARLIDFLKS